VGQLGLCLIWACPTVSSAGRLYKEARSLEFTEAENFVELCVPTCVPSLRGWCIETASPMFI
jgi:hypothetical protein